MDLTRSDSTHRAAIDQNVGLLILRTALGALFVGHSLNKLLGWFHGAGLDASGRFFASVGYSPGRNYAILAGVTELAVGVLLVAGLLVPLAAAAITGDMLNAAAVKDPHGFWISNGGYELEAVLVTVALCLAYAGAGTYSLDRGRRGTRGVVGFLVAAVVGFGAGAVLLTMRNA